MRIRKAERDALEAALSADNDSLDAVVDTVWNLFQRWLAEREWFTTVAKLGVSDDSYLLFGPYASDSEARKAARGLVSPGPLPGVARVYRLGTVPDAS